MASAANFSSPSPRGAIGRRPEGPRPTWNPRSRLSHALPVWLDRRCPRIGRRNSAIVPCRVGRNHACDYPCALPPGVGTLRLGSPQHLVESDGPDGDRARGRRAAAANSALFEIQDHHPVDPWAVWRSLGLASVYCAGASSVLGAVVAAVPGGLSGMIIDTVVLAVAGFLTAGPDGALGPRRPPGGVGAGGGEFPGPGRWRPGGRCARHLGRGGSGCGARAVSSAVCLNVGCASGSACVCWGRSPGWCWAGLSEQRCWRSSPMRAWPWKGRPRAACSGRGRGWYWCYWAAGGDGACRARQVS